MRRRLPRAHCSQPYLLLHLLLPRQMQITFNGDSREITPPVTIAQLLQELQLDPRRVAVELNRDLIPRENHQDVSLAEGDTMEVVTLVGGG